MQSILLMFTLLFGVMVCVSSENFTTQPSIPTTQPTSVAPDKTTLPPITQSSTTSDPTTQATSVTPDKTTLPPTTQSPMTTASPTPMSIGTDETVNDYAYSKNNTICLMARFSAHFQMGKMVWNVTKDAYVDNTTSLCDVLSVKFGSSMSFSIGFNQTEKDAFYIDEVNADLGDINSFAGNLKLAKASNGSSYMCTSGIEIPLSNNVTLYMKEIQLQPYRVKDGKFATALECVGDFPNNMLVPIIVGCSLGGLIVVVLLAYCILRARATRNYGLVSNTF